MFCCLFIHICYLLRHYPHDTNYLSIYLICMNENNNLLTNERFIIWRTMNNKINYIILYVYINFSWKSVMLHKVKLKI